MPTKKPTTKKQTKRIKPVKPKEKIHDRVKAIDPKKLEQATKLVNPVTVSGEALKEFLVQTLTVMKMADPNKIKILSCTTYKCMATGKQKTEIHGMIDRSAHKQPPLVFQMGQYK